MSGGMEIERFRQISAATGNLLVLFHLRRPLLRSVFSAFFFIDCISLISYNDSKYRGVMQIIMSASSQKDSKKDTVRISATLSSDQYELLTKMAKKSKVSVAWCVRMAVERLIEEREGRMLPFEHNPEKG